MNLALRLAVACFVIAAPTLLYLGLRWLRDDALLADLTRSDDAPEDVSSAASALEKPSIRADSDVHTDNSVRADSSIRADSGVRTDSSVRADGSGRADGGGHADAPERAPRPETVACSNCGTSNMLGARYCGECLEQMR